MDTGKCLNNRMTRSFPAVEFWHWNCETDAIWLAYEIWKQKQFTRGQSRWKSDISQEP